MLAYRHPTEVLAEQHETADRGRHLRASDHVPAGKRVLQEEAVSAVLYDEHVAHRCHMTFSLVQSPLRCGGCKHARYASRENQRLAWSLGHRQECAALQACLPNMPPPTVRLVARLYWRMDRLKAETPARLQVQHSEIDGLEHHWDDLPDSKKQLYAQMAALTRATSPMTQTCLTRSHWH